MRKVKITFADDDLDDHLLIREAVKQLDLNCEIVSVYNGMQLLDLLRKEDGNNRDQLPDMILLDLNMPVLDGFEALRHIKQNAQLKHLPVYVLSTSSSSYDKQRALDYGATEYHSKSILFEDLKRLIKRIFGNLEVGAH